MRWNIQIQWRLKQNIQRIRAFPPAYDYWMQIHREELFNEMLSSKKCHWNVSMKENPPTLPVLSSHCHRAWLKRPEQTSERGSKIQDCHLNLSVPFDGAHRGSVTWVTRVSPERPPVLQSLSDPSLSCQVVLNYIYVGFSL